MLKRSLKTPLFSKSILVVLVAFIISLSLVGCNKDSVAVNNPSVTSKSPTETPKSSEKVDATSVPSDATPAPDDGTGEKTNSAKKDIKVKALYLTGWTVSSDEKVKKFVELAKNTEINAYVLDIKDDDGFVGYESNIPAVREVGGWMNKYNAEKVLKEFHDNDIHVVGRLVCFKDPVLSKKKPDLAVKSARGGAWKDNHNLTWLNPYNKDCWPYLIEIAKEAVAKGFDEIQFDYVRFPNDGSKKDMNFGNVTTEKHQAINEFLAYARENLPGVVISADVFGIILESPGDTEGIGQHLETVGKDIDYISPMVYPSHYAVGQKVNGVQFMKPDMDPYGVVYNSLAKCKDRISKVEGGYKAGVRAYLQDFTASWLGKGYYQSYGPEQVKQQIKAVYDAGYEEWIFWDAANTYSESAFLKESN